jgi:Tripartite tricarboxylate transporter TctB family
MNGDRIAGVIWFVFGAAVFYGSWTMDRLASQNINPLTVPGLLPGLLGMGMMVMALVLMSRRRIGRAVSIVGVAPDDEPNTDWKRLLASWALCVAFAGSLLGRGLPFWLLAASFVFVHILVLEDRHRIEGRSFLRRLIEAALIAAATSAFVTYLFQNLFLIRLP